MSAPSTREGRDISGEELASCPKIKERESCLLGDKNVSGNKLDSLAEMEVQELSLPSGISQLSLRRRRGSLSLSLLSALSSPSCPEGGVRLCHCRGVPVSVPHLPAENSISHCPRKRWGVTLPALCHGGQSLRKGMIPHNLGPWISPCPPQAVAAQPAPCLCPHPLLSDLSCPVILLGPRGSS